MNRLRAFLRRLTGGPRHPRRVAPPLPTFRSENLWALPPVDWRKVSAAALIVGAAAGWLLRGGR